MTPYLLNLADLAFTLIALSLGIREADPLLQSVPWMIFYKVILIGLLCFVLSRNKTRLARAGLWLCTAVYGAVCVWHMIGFTMILA